VTKLCALIAVVWAGGCASIAPAVPRFVTVYEQATGYCRIHIVRDTRTTACFVTFKCAHQPVVALAAAPDVCVP